METKEDKCRAVLSFNLQLNISVRITDQSANKSQAKLIINMLLLTVKRIFHLFVDLVKIDLVKYTECQKHVLVNKVLIMKCFTFHITCIELLSEDTC